MIQSELEHTKFTGDEETDRLMIQDKMDDPSNPLSKAEWIGYAGNGVMPLKKTVNEIMKLRKTNDLGKMSKRFYMDFLLCAIGDIAHYNKEGYIDYYDNSFHRVEDEVISKSFIPVWRTDVHRILRECGYKS
jgi:hypothetical protein